MGKVYYFLNVIKYSSNILHLLYLKRKLNVIVSHIMQVFQGVVNAVGSKELWG